MGSEQPVGDAAPQESDAAVSSMGPTVLRITLGTQLRALREAAGLTREAAAGRSAARPPRSADWSWAVCGSGTAISPTC